MNFKFDSATGFLITKAMEKLIGNNTSQDVNINITQSTSKNSVEKTPKTTSKPRAVPPRKNNNSPRVTRTLQRNNYMQTNDAINAGGKIFGGELYGVLGELKSAISMPMGMAKGIYGKYKEKRETKQDNKHEDAMAKESENQSKSLEEILKEVKQKGSSSKFSFGKMGIGAGLLGGLFAGGWKGLLKKLGIVGLIATAFDGYGASLKKIADEQGVDISSLGISDKFQAIFNNIGNSTVKFLNMMGAEIDPKIVETFTATTKEGVKTALSNLEDNYPKFGKAITSLLGATDDALGKATTWIGDATAVALDAFRKKSDLEKEYIKAQDTVRNYDTFGSTLSGTSKAEYEQAKAKKRELAQQLIKDEDVKKNSPYYKKMLKDINPKSAKEAELATKRKQLKKIVGDVRGEAKALEEQKKEGWITKKLKYSSEKAYEEEIKTKEHQLEQHRKLVDTAKKIVLEAEKALEEIKQSTRGTSDTAIFEGNGNLLETIADGEGTSDAKAKARGYHSGYDVTLGYGKYADDKTNPVSNMSLKEVYAHQKKMKADPSNRHHIGNGVYRPSSAVGKYQIVEPTLKRLQKRLGLSDDAKFDKKTQDAMAQLLLKDAGADDFKNGKITSQQYQDKIAKIWASVANSSTGKSAYGQGTGTSTSAIQGAIHNTKVAKVVKSPMRQPVKQKAVAEEIVKNEPKKETKTKTAQANTDFAPFVKAVVDSNNQVVKAIEKGTKVAQAKTKVQESSIIVNIENKSTNQNIGGMV